jgi:hypothetical protein
MRQIIENSIFASAEAEECAREMCFVCHLQCGERDWDHSPSVDDTTSSPSSSPLAQEGIERETKGIEL